MLNKILTFRKKPLVSIIVPIYNTGQFIEETVKSITLQSFQDFEIILVDDGSTDNSIDIMRELQKGDNRIVILEQDNKGAGGARNYGIKEAKGKYIRFIDSDDLIPKDSMELMLNKIESSEDDFIMGPILLLNNGKTKIPKAHIPIYSENFNRIKKPYNMIPLGTNASCCNKLYKKDFLTKHNIKFPEGLIAEDVVFTFSCYLFADSIGILSKKDVVYYWRVRKGSVSRSGYSEKYITDRLKITDIMENIIVKNGLKDKPLAIRIRKRNINSILDIIKKSKMRNFTRTHFEYYKKQLEKLENSGFNLNFNPNSIMKQIINIIKKYNYIEAKNKILLVIKEKLEYDNKGFSEVDNITLIGNDISFFNNKRSIFNWTNDNSIFFEIPNLSKGKYVLSFEYSWSSIATKNNFRLGILSGDNNIFNNLVFPRTKNWKTYSKIYTTFCITDMKENLFFQLRPFNQKGVGFINLNKIKYKKIS